MFYAELCYIISVGEFFTLSTQTVLYIQTMKSSEVLIHFPNRADVQVHLERLGLKYKTNDDELDVIVSDVPYEIMDGTYQDPDEQLCEHYGINYDLVNCIELI